MLLVAGVLSIGGLVGCDPDAGGGDAAGTGAVGEGDGGTDADAAPPGACESSPQEGVSLLDHANCVIAGASVASCTVASNLLRDCDSTFVEWCQSIGGDVEACDEDGLKPPSFPKCDAGPSTPPCDVEFRDTCDALDWSYHEDGTGAFPTGGGSCVPIPAVECCPVGPDAPDWADWQCTCTAESSGVKGVIGAMLECLQMITAHSCLGNIGGTTVWCDAPYGDDTGLPSSC